MQKKCKIIWSIQKKAVPLHPLLTNSKKSSTFAPAFDEKLYIVATLAQLVEQRIRNA